MADRDRSIDSELIRKSIRHNARAQRLLYDKYKVKWFMICLRYSRNRNEAEDMLQEGLIGIFNNLKQFDAGRAAFPAWSNKVMVNAALQYLRKWKKADFDRSFDDYDYNLSCDGENIYEILGAKELTAIIQKLPVGYRVVFNLYVIEGYKHREIAEMLNISESTSKTQLLKAKKLLRLQLEKVLNH